MKQMHQDAHVHCMRNLLIDKGPGSQAAALHIKGPAVLCACDQHTVVQFYRLPLHTTAYQHAMGVVHTPASANIIQAAFAYEVKTCKGK